ncbi:MAG: ABC transporter ATP-binding protein [Deltaproteobacteria bacterium]|nr:ABC transporter ATP-binding protein [Candidatus Zymogenaceae bacterium]
MSYLSLQNISRRFGEIVALDDISLNLERERITAVLGPSGCGKSTLLRIAAGLEVPDTGSVFLDDRDITHLPPRERNVAMVFQDFALYPHMTVEKNLTFGLTVRGTPRREAKKKAYEAAELLGITDLLGRKPGKLSGGQQQRVALGRAIVKDPAIFLMDEPLSNIDAQLRGRMRTEIASLMRDVKGTLLYVTHDQVEAMTIADTLAVIENGRLLMAAPPREVYDRPADLFVARFVGTPSMNIIEPKEPLYRDLAGLLAKKAASPNGSILGFRPEALSITPEDDTLSVALEARVVFVEEMGHENHLTVEISGSRLVIREERRSPSPGETVTVFFDAGRMHRFDADTGKRHD